MACRLEEIPNPGDFVDYQICDYSILIVRQADNGVKAFFNTCPHRATQLCIGGGRLPGGQIVCPFHGWRWNLDGTNSFVYAPQGFDPDTIRAEDIRLSECTADVWAGCVWINMDPHARPLQDALSPAAQILDNAGIGNMRVWWWKETILDANWKIAQEAFHEGYHVMQSHPQLTMGAGENYPHTTEYTTWENGHARFQSGSRLSIGGGKASPDDFIARSRVLWEGQDAMTLERDIKVFEGIRNKIPAEENFPQAAMAALYDYAAGAGIPMPPLESNLRLWGGEIFLFPNFFILPMYGNAAVYRIRPHDDNPERCRFDVWSLTTYPEGLEPERARLKGRFASDDPDGWGLIPRQDFSNIARQQRGLHNPHYRQSRLSSAWEQAISNMHYELDRYLGA
jgi:phenylpropionate dioxygenase-like ring-hydroxylating dioxygenase large terminal subunit